MTAGLSRREYKSAGLDLKLQNACADIGMLLGDRPPGTTADISRAAVLYWDAGKLQGASLSDDEPDGLGLPVELEDLLPAARTAIAQWLAHPASSYRPSLLEWLESPITDKPLNRVNRSGMAAWTSCGRAVEGASAIGMVTIYGLMTAAMLAASSAMKCLTGTAGTLAK